jgi:hypothetical protein
MHYRLAALLLVLIAFTSRSAGASDRDKAEKQINRISAMAADLTGRRLVNRSMSQVLTVSTLDLVAERRRHNLSYGTLFLFHQIATTDERLREFVLQLRQGSEPFDIAEAAQADWKTINNHAKKLNSKIEDSIYNFFLHQQNDKPKNKLPAESDGYDPISDSVVADSIVSQEDLADAQKVYLFWQGRATAKKDGTLEHNKELAARQTMDPVRKGGPQGDQMGNMGPAVNTTPH